jgi:hypothetical protein
MYHPLGLNQVEQLRKNDLLPSEQQKALDEFIELVRQLEDVDTGLPISSNDFWSDPVSHKIYVDQPTLRKIESYLQNLGVSYTKNENSIVVDKIYNDGHLCGSSCILYFTSEKELQKQKELLIKSPIA